MKFSAEFLAPGDNASPEEANTVAKIKILIGNENATDMRIVGENQIQNYVVAPAYPIAESLAFQWWQTLYGRGRHINLRASRSGFVLPDISVFGTGNGRIDIRCRPYAYDNPKIQFVTTANEGVRISDLADEFERFFMSVLDRLGQRGVISDVLNDQFEKIETSIDDPEEFAFCRAAGALGVDPYSCDERISNLILSAGRFFDADGLEEFLAGLPPREGVNTLAWVAKAEAELNQHCELPAIEEVKTRLGYRRREFAPWTEGYVSARKVREILRVPGDAAVGNVQQIANLFGNSEFKLADRAPLAVRGISHVEQDHPKVIVPRQKYADSEIFSVARTIGDAIHFGSEKYSPVTNQTGTYRQQMGRAFAAEFLAPVEAILEMRENSSDSEIADHFGVAEHLIQHQLENQYRILAA